MIYLTADTHFGSQRTLELSKRPYGTTEEMDKAFITNWNNTVSKDDTVYHLGDFGTYEIVSKLNGAITLICGNYEVDDLNKNYSSFESFRQHLLSLGFADVIKDELALDTPDVPELNGIRMTHRPEDCDKDGFSFFGHIHKLCMVKRYGLNVGLDSHNFRPIDLNTLMFYKTAIQKYYDHNVFE